jgi:hypothetical protein
MKVTSSLPANYGSNIYSVDGNVKEAYFDPARQETQRTLVRTIPVRPQQTVSSENIIDVYKKSLPDLITEQRNEDDDRKPFQNQLTSFIKSHDSVTQGQIAQQLYPQEFATIGVDSYKKTSGLSTQRTNILSRGSIIDLWA